MLKASASRARWVIELLYLVNTDPRDTARILEWALRLKWRAAKDPLPPFKKSRRSHWVSYPHAPFDLKNRVFSRLEGDQ